MKAATITEVIEGISKNLCNSCFKHHHFCPHKEEKICPIIDEFKRSAYEACCKSRADRSERKRGRVMNSNWCESCARKADGRKL